MGLLKILRLEARRGRWPPSCSDTALYSGNAGARFVSEQGAKMGRRSILHVQLHGEQGADGIEVGGYVSPVAEATLFLSLKSDAA